MARLTNYKFTNSFPYLLNRVGVRIAELFDERIAMYGVTMPMYRVLAALRERPDQRLSDLSNMTTIEISTLSRLVGTMKRKGLVSRRRPEDNGRTVAINLTAKGRGLVDELIPSSCISKRLRSVIEALPRSNGSIVRWRKPMTALTTSRRKSEGRW